jgi:hypothetical protein
MKFLARESIFGRMEKFIEDNGKIIKGMESKIEK